jgi:hypothetical protein
MGGVEASTKLWAAVAARTKRLLEKVRFRLYRSKYMTQATGPAPRVGLVM